MDKLKVLIAEDDLLIADMIEDSLTSHGFAVCGIATTVADGLALAEQHVPDLAVVDVRLDHGDLGTTLAAELKRRQPISVLYATGNVDAVLDDAVAEACLTKPFRLDVLAHSLEILGQLTRNGVITPLLPDGLIMLRHGIEISRQLLAACAEAEQIRS